MLVALSRPFVLLLHHSNVNPFLSFPPAVGWGGRGEAWRGVGGRFVRESPQRLAEPVGVLCGRHARTLRQVLFFLAQSVPPCGRSR